MKSVKSILAVAILVLTVAAVNAQSVKTITIKTSAQCDMCEEKIEKNIALEKGVTDVDLDVKTKILTVSYKPSKTDADKIKKAVTMLGYDADDLVADSDAYSKLPDCCKKPIVKKTPVNKSNCGHSPKGCGGHTGPKKCGGSGA